MSHMKAEISGPETWLQIDGSNGTTNVPTDVAGLPDCPPAVGEWPVGEEISEDWIAGRLEHTYPQTAAVRAERVWAEIVSAVADYYDGPKDGIQSVQLVTGWGVRSQAPGYVDATEWTVYTSEDEAREAYQAEREENGEEPEEEPEEDDEPPEFVPGTHALTTSPDELALCAQVAAAGPRSVALAMLADWREERDLPAPGSAVEFFAWQSGCGLPGSAARLEAARKLAAAEQWGREKIAADELRFDWEPDADADWEARRERSGYGPHEFCVLLRPVSEWEPRHRYAQWEPVRSLHGIDRPSADYRRFIEAELLSEYRAEIEDAPPELIPLIPADEPL